MSQNAGERSKIDLIIEAFVDPESSVAAISSYSGSFQSGLDWPLCHCAMAQAPPSTNTGAPWPLTGNITGNYQ